MKTRLAWNLNSGAEAAIAPQDSVVPRLCHFAQILLGKEQFVAALGQFDAALQRQPNYWPAWVGRSQTLLRLGRDAQALQSLEQAAELLQTPHPELLLLRAQLLLKLKSPQRALGCCEAALAIAPTHLRAHLLRARLLVRSGRFRTLLAGIPTLSPPLAHDIHVNQVVGTELG